MNVSVKIMEVEWVGDNLNKFYTYLNNVEESALFENVFIKALLEQHDYTRQLILKVVLPYGTYTAICLYYFSMIVPNYTVKDATFMGNGIGFDG